MAARSCNTARISLDKSSGLKSCICFGVNGCIATFRSYPYQRGKETVFYQSYSDRYEDVISEKGGCRNRTRTCDPLINSQLLYQLSYAALKE